MKKKTIKEYNESLLRKKDLIVQITFTSEEQVEDIIKGCNESFPHYNLIYFTTAGMEKSLTFQELDGYKTSQTNYLVR